MLRKWPRASNSSAKKNPKSQSKQGSGNSGNGNAGKGKKQRGRGRYKVKNKDQDGRSGDGKKSEGCWNCGGHGHIRVNCPNPKKSDNSQSQKQYAGMEAKRFQNKKGGDATGVRKSIDALTQCKIGATVVGGRRRKSRVMEWVLDTATDVHVCTDLKLLNISRPDREHLFLDFDGQPKGNRMVGDVNLQVMNVRSRRDEVLTLTGDVHTPTGPDNLLSSHLLEESGWSIEFTQMDGNRVCQLEKGDMKLLLKKTKDRYRLQARPAEVREVRAVSQTAITRSDPLTMKSVELERWHMRFAHLKYAALRRMATQGTVVGLEGLYNDGECLSVHDRKCWTCIASKQKRMYKKTLTRRATKPYQKLMSDFGPVGVETYDGYIHF